MSDTCRLFPPFGDPWPSCLLPSQLDHEEGWAPKNWCFPIVMLEKTLESPLACKEIKPVNPKGNQPWIFFGRTNAEAEAEAPAFWPPDAKNHLIGKDPDAGKDWGQEEMGGQMRWLASITQSKDVNLSHEKDQIWVSWAEVDEPRAYYK